MNSEFEPMMSCLRYKLCALLLAALPFFMSGCGTLFEKVPIHREFSPLPEKGGCRVAVLPFLNDSAFPLGDEIVKKVFSAELQSAGDLMVIQEGDVLKVFQQLRLLPGKEPSLEQLQIIGDRVDAQFLVTGTVYEMREDRAQYQTVNPVIILEIQLRDAVSGETLWTTFHRRQGTDYKKTMHFGTIHTVTGLSRQMAEEILKLWYKKGFAQCNG